MITVQDLPRTIEEKWEQEMILAAKYEALLAKIEAEEYEEMTYDTKHGY